MSRITILKEECKETLSKELEKFFETYSSLKGEPFSFKELERKQGYDKIIRNIGCFISKFDVKTWDSDYIVFGDKRMDLSVFRGTKYFTSVENFLMNLNEIFNTSLESEIEEFFNNCEFCPEHIELCRKYHRVTERLNKCIVKNIFSDHPFDIKSNEDIKMYIEDEMKDFYEITSYIAKDNTLVKVIEIFLQIVEEIMIKKEKPVIFFNNCI